MLLNVTLVTFNNIDLYSQSKKEHKTHTTNKTQNLQRYGK